MLNLQKLCMVPNPYMNLSSYLILQFQPETLIAYLLDGSKTIGFSYKPPQRFDGIMGKE